jgi:hypothetical protein
MKLKLEQDQIKKIGLGSGVVAALLYGYFAFMLGPLQETERTAENGIAAVKPQISDAKKQIAMTATLEAKAPDALAFLNSLKAGIPDGAPIAWFPPKMADFFKHHGIDKCSTRLVSEESYPMPGFRKIVWSVDIPKVEFEPLGEALASLENDQPLLTVMDVAIDAIREDAQFQHVTLTVVTVVKS